MITVEGSQVVALAREELDEALSNGKQGFEDNEFWPAEVLEQQHEQHEQQEEVVELQIIATKPRASVPVVRRARFLEPLTFLFLALFMFAMQAVGAEPAFKANDWVTYKPGGKSKCSHGDPYAFFARAGNSSGSPLVVEFEGG